MYEYISGEKIYICISVYKYTLIYNVPRLDGYSLSVYR